MGDILIPILGFFLWDWTIYFICLFFLLDQITREVGHLYRLRKVRNRIVISTTSYVFNVLIFIALLLVIHAFNLRLTPSIQFLQELNDFFWYQDMGLAQGFILIPLVLFSEWMRLNLNLKQFSDEKHVEIWQSYSIQLLAYCLLFLLLYLGLLFINMSKTTSFLWLILGFTLITFFSDKTKAFFPR